MSRERLGGVDRRILQQELARARGISQLAQDPRAFNPAGGAPVFAAQLATAGIGVFAQNKARKELAAQELASQQAFTRVNPEFGNIASQLSPEARENITLRKAIAQTTPAPASTPLSPLGKIQADVQAGFISPEQAQLSIKKVTSTDPLVQVTTGETQTQFQKERGKVAAKQFEAANENATNAITFNQNLDEVEAALDEGAFTGVGASKIAFINEALASLGLPADLDKASNTRAIQQRLSALAIEATKNLKGAISEKELDLAKQSVLKLGTSEQANRQAIAILRRLNQKQIQIGDLANRLAEEGRFVQDFAKERKKLRCKVNVKTMNPTDLQNLSIEELQCLRGEVGR